MIKAAFNERMLAFGVVKPVARVAPLCEVLKALWDFVL